MYVFQLQQFHIKPEDLELIDLSTEQALDKFINNYKEKQKLLAQIPWAPKSEMANIPFHMGKFHKKMLEISDDLDMGKRKLVLYLLLDSSFPFFLPPR